MRAKAIIKWSTAIITMLGCAASVCAYMATGHEGFVVTSLVTFLVCCASLDSDL